MFCKHCGYEIDSQAKFCIKCGAALDSSIPNESLGIPRQTSTPVNTSFGYNENSQNLNILSFLIPIVGLVLYAVYYQKEPIKANGVRNWALVGFVVGVIGAALFEACSTSM